MLGAVREPDLDFARQRDHELPARGVVPVREVAGLGRPEHDALGALKRRELRMGGEVQLLDMGLAVLAGVQANDMAHLGPPRAGSPRQSVAGPPRPYNKPLPFAMGGSKGLGVPF